MENSTSDEFSIIAYTNNSVTLKNNQTGQQSTVGYNNLSKYGIHLSTSQLAQMEGFGNNATDTGSSGIGIIIVLVLAVIVIFFIVKVFLPSLAKYSGGLGKEFKKGLEETSFCKECGAKLYKDSKFCVKCGSKV